MATGDKPHTADSGRHVHPARRWAFGEAPFVSRFLSRRIEISPGSLADLRAAGIAEFEGVWELSGGEVLTQHRDRSVCRVSVPCGGRRLELFVKRLGRAHLKQVLESLFSLERPLSKCLREWKFAGLLEAAGVSPPPMLAAGEVRLGPLPLESFLVIGEMEGARDLDEYVRDGDGSGPPGAAARRELIGELAGTVARMHSAGLFHQDLYAKHIFIRRTGGKFVINIIDLQRMRKSSRECFAVKDLAALNVTLPSEVVSDFDRLRFLAAYARCRWGGDGASRAPRLLRRVLRRSLHIGGRRKFSGVDWRP